SGPRHLPGSNGRTLAALTDGYLFQLRGPLEIADDLLARWEAIQAAARMAEGVPRGALFEVWTRYERTDDSARAVRPGSAPEQPLGDLALHRAKLGLVREARRHEGLGERHARGDRDRLPVPPCSATEMRREELVAQYVDHGARHDLAVQRRRDAHGEERHP